jgi:uncharacterized membrane protein YphA (DoxX/SURF4 family)
VVVAICRIVVGGLLLMSGAAKLRQPAWPATAKQFGTPVPLIPVLPWTELVLGALLIAQIGGRWIAGAALALLAAFTVAIATHVVAGNRVPCGCFGEATTKPVSHLTILRNLALCGLCLVAAVGPGH